MKGDYMVMLSQPAFSLDLPGTDFTAFWALGHHMWNDAPVHALLVWPKGSRAVFPSQASLLCPLYLSHSTRESERQHSP